MDDQEAPLAPIVQQLHTAIAAARTQRAENGGSTAPYLPAITAAIELLEHLAGSDGVGDGAIRSRVEELNALAERLGDIERRNELLAERLDAAQARLEGGGEEQPAAGSKRKKPRRRRAAAK